MQVRGTGGSERVDAKGEHGDATGAGPKAGAR